MTDVLLITGTSRGLGRALAMHYVAKGYNIVGVSRSDSDLKSEFYRHYCLDISDESQVRMLFSGFRRQGLQVYGLINNAGISATQMGHVLDCKTFDNILKTNVLGSFIMTREAARMMQKVKFGRVINFSSINVPLNSSGAMAYNASKAANESVSGTMASELSEFGITFNTVGLSLVEDSGMIADLSESALQAKINRLTRPAALCVEEVAHVLDFFLSRNAGNITNQIVYFGGIR